MSDNEKNFFINNPVFVRYKRVFDLRRLRSLPRLKSLNINERVVEIPFALECLQALGAPRRVLDVGCMESLLPFYMAALDFQVVGVDLREFPYRFPNFEFRQADILALPFADGHFNAVTCISTVEHIGIDFYEGSVRSDDGDHRAVAELRRVLQPQGVLVLTVPFGQRQVTRQQRVYDYPQVQELMTGFRVEDVRFFENRRDSSCRNNFWAPLSLSEAVGPQPSEVERVCLVKSRKCG